MGLNNSRQVNNLTIVDGRFLSLVREIIYNRAKQTLSAIALSPRGHDQRFVVFLNSAKSENSPSVSHIATGVTIENFLAFVSAVETETGYRFLGNPEENADGTKTLHCDSRIDDRIDGSGAEKTPPPINFPEFE